MQGSVEETQRRIASYPESSILISDARTHGRHLEGLRRRALLDAIRERMDNSASRPPGVEYFFSAFVPVEGYLVTLAIGVDRAEVDSYPRLQSSEIWLHEARSNIVPTCLIDAVIRQLLYDATAVLARADKEDFITSRSIDDTLRDAAGTMLHGVIGRCAAFTETFGGETSAFDNICRIANAAYEKSTAVGKIAIARRGHPATKAKLELTEPSDFGNIRRTRKLLELTRSGNHLLHTNSNEVLGLVSINEYNLADNTEDLFEIRFCGPQKWECRHRGRVLMCVDNRIPKLTDQEINAEQIKADLVRFFPDMREEIAETYVKLIQTCGQGPHGALLLISSEAEKESVRLAKQSTPIRRIQADYELIHSLASIDGAVLLDTEGYCWAIGVILDGLASMHGDPSRGSRFNSSIRYIETRSETCVAVVVSEDGGVTMIPELLPRLSRAKIDANLRAIQDTVESAVVRRSVFDNIIWLDEHRFYLTSADCQILNKLIPEIETRWKEESGSMVRHVQPKWEQSPEFDPAIYYCE